MGEGTDQGVRSVDRLPVVEVGMPPWGVVGFPCEFGSRTSVRALDLRG